MTQELLTAAIVMLAVFFSIRFVFKKKDECNGCECSDECELHKLKKKNF